MLPVLARSFLGGEPEAEEVASRGAVTLGRRWRWLGPLARRYAARFGHGTRPQLREVVDFLRADDGLYEARRVYGARIRVVHWVAEPERMLPVDALAGCALPRIESAGELAAWCGVTPEVLAWMADLKGLARRARGPLGHYHLRVVTKPDGGLRLIEAPKPKLKALQRRVLAEILERVPAHGAVHGFVRGRSARTFAQPHTGRGTVLRVDLREFFQSIPAARIASLVRTAGYPGQVAALLAGLCTSVVPRATWAGAAGEPHALRAAWERYRWPHLPQGAPTSPALANLCAYRMDCRLSALAHAAGFVYTRYADDLAFSAAETRGSGEMARLLAQIAVIVAEEGFAVQQRKTRVMRRGVRQHLAGLVVNDHLNVARDDFDRLKAELTNCARLEPESQNRERHPHYREHLLGRVAFVESVRPMRGAKLRTIFEAIRWEAL